MQFSLIHTSTLPWPVNPDLVSWCPTMDLVMLAPASGSGLTLYRVNGQRVWTSAGRRTAKPQRLLWKDNGKVLTVVYSDGAYQMHSTNNGRIIYASDTNDVRLIQWKTATSTAANATDANSNSPTAHNSANSINTTVIDGPDWQTHIFKQLPKLSPLPTGPVIGPNATRLAFSDDTSLSLLVSAHDSGALEFSLYGIFSIGSVNLLETKSLSSVKRSDDLDDSSTSVVSISLTDNLSTCWALTQRGNCLSLHTLSLDFILKTGRHIRDIAMLPVQILATMEYIKEAIDIVHSEICNIVDATQVFFELSDDSDDDGHRETDAIKADKTSAQIFRTQLFDFLVTGIISRPIHDWINRAHEKGYRKWNKATVTGYEQIRRTLFENLIQASDRLIYLLSQLRGLGRWRDKGELLGIDPQLIEETVDSSCRFLEKINALLWQVNSEYMLFQGFLKWIEQSFEKVLDKTLRPRDQSAGSSSSSSAASEFKTLDVCKYLDQYFPGSLSKSSTDAAVDLLKSVETTLLLSLQGIAGKLRSLISIGPPIGLATQLYTTVGKCVGDVLYLFAYQSGTMARSASDALKSERTSAIPESFLKPTDPTRLTILIINRRGQVWAANVSCDGAVIQAEFVNETTAMIMQPAVETAGDLSESGARLKLFSYASLKYTQIVADIEHREKSDKSAWADIMSKVSGVSATSLEPLKEHEFEDMSAGRFAVNGMTQRPVGCLVSTGYTRYSIFDLD